MYNRLIFLMIVLPIVTTSILHAHVIYVPSDSTTIQGGIRGASEGDTVMVAPGTYYEYDIDFLGKAITVMGTDPSDSIIVNTTVIDADSLGKVFWFHMSEDSSSILTGLTITGGNAMEGGGIHCVSASPTIRYCVIVDNSADAGAGIFCENSSPIVNHCRITDNIATVWAGVTCNNGGTLRISNCVVKGNIAMDAGTGIYCGYATLLMTNCIVRENRSLRWNGITCYANPLEPDSSSIISGSLVVLNSSYSEGGAISLFNSFPEITNCTIAHNTSNELYGVDSSPIIINTIIWGSSMDEINLQGESSPIINYSNIRGGWPGEGNIDEDPRFRTHWSEEYHLQTVECGDPFESPCIDAGNPGLFDDVLDCMHGLATNRSDMGAFGGSNSGWSTGIEENETNSLSHPKSFSLSQNYPNPFNPSTTIEYSIPEGEPVRTLLKIFDIRGKLVKTLIEAERGPGMYSAHWDGRNQKGAVVRSGVYLYRIIAGSYSSTKKMVIAK